MAEAAPDFMGAWLCPKAGPTGRDDPRHYCPPEGCPKGFCARENGWKPGDPSPDRCTGKRAQPEDMGERG